MVNIMSGLSTAMAGSGYLGAFLASFLMILCAEIGDKTFFIAAVLSMKHNHIIVFLGAIGALALMTVLSAALGFLLPTLLSKNFTHYTCIALFLYFGIKLLKEAYEMDAGNEESEELKEVEMELK
ncbi:conserved hypothetical protein [Perkinsus marinus ATCC 50983]|uniref:GDT1 family protein n=1 Tax=Perkinsus marinus (strain ATCC 50983 / TXsc) TaxID=423536 RepID=C5KMV8_PERM5|nr:conserved hypothetical protein [Perkinsus marinus ATCC 50983]EER14266.1 conserved hypothetical protein [Perkinsus marinus ATCC 50983]|eukprot:XP_002782471.1 conserved hypothetical protein [Perkinsus marinus ATCC 50983]